MTGRRFILKYIEDHDMYPGFQEGFSLVEQDEHRLLMDSPPYRPRKRPRTATT